MSRIVTATDIEVWETENAVLVIWGTHKAIAAYDAARSFYMEDSEVPSGLLAEILSTVSSDRGLIYADPAVLDLEDEVWPKHFTSLYPIAGWVPVMIICW